jgi:hypothetical protein
MKGVLMEISKLPSGDVVITEDGAPDLLIPHYVIIMNRMHPKADSIGVFLLGKGVVCVHCADMIIDLVNGTPRSRARFSHPPGLH